VTFRWKDYRHGSQLRLMTISVDEFRRRFCLHVLPKGFVRIRFYGFLPPRRRTEDLPRCRRVLNPCRRQALATPFGETSPSAAPPPCPQCGGVMVIIERLNARQIYLRGFAEGRLTYES